MSYLRAVLNCRRCYELANISCMDGDLTRIQNDQLWTARNEAMKALEDSLIPLTARDTLKPGAKEAMQDNVQFTRAINACLHCEYKQAEIAEIFYPSDGSV